MNRLNRRQRRRLQFGKHESMAPAAEKARPSQLMPPSPAMALPTLVRAIAMATPLVLDAHFAGRQRCLEMSRAVVSVLRAFAFEAKLRPVVLVASYEEIVFTCGNPRTAYDFLCGTWFSSWSPEEIPTFEDWVMNAFEADDRNLEGFHVVAEAVSGTRCVVVDVTFSQIAKAFPFIELPNVYAGFSDVPCPWPSVGKAGRPQLDLVYVPGPELPTHTNDPKMLAIAEGAAVDLETLTTMALAYESDVVGFRLAALAGRLRAPVSI